MSSAPVLSVVIPTHNRRDSIRRTMDALAGQTLGPGRFEVIVVADGCRDDTVAMLRSLELPFRLLVLEQDGSGAATARNRGVVEARGELLACMDDDIEPLPGMLEAFLREHRREPGRLLIGHSPPRLAEERSFFGMALRNWWLDHIFDMQKPAHRFSWRDMHAGNFSIARELYLALEGFDQAFPGCGGEDYEFGVRLLARGVRFAFVTDAFGWHHESSDIPRSFRRARQEGRADVLIGLRHPTLRFGLPLARYWKPTTRTMRWLRDQAFRQRRGGLAVSGALERLLPAFEWGRARRRWNASYGLARAWWYLRGAAEELGGLGELDRFFETAVHPEYRVIEVDLADGIAAARATIAAQEADAAAVHYRGRPLGMIAGEAGAEPLRPVHLDYHLATQSVPLLVALAESEMESPGAWERCFGEPAASSSWAGGNDRLAGAGTVAGLALARSQDVSSALSLVQGIRDPILNPWEFATVVCESLVAEGKEVGSINDSEYSDLVELCREIERISGTAGFAERTAVMLQRRILTAPGCRHQALGSTARCEIEITSPVEDVVPGDRFDRLVAAVSVEGIHLGTVELPVVDGRVTAAVLADTIADVHGWEILGRFFGKGVYPAGSGSGHHEEAGWVTLLRNCWNRPGWTEPDFYTPATVERGNTFEASSSVTWMASTEVTDIETSEPADVGVTLWSEPLGILRFIPEGGKIPASMIIGGFTAAAGLELVTHSVREALVGTGWRAVTLEAQSAFRPRQSRRSVTLPRWPGPIGTPSSRRTTIPAAAAPAAFRLAGQGPGAPGPVEVDPACIRWVSPGVGSGAPVTAAPAFDRHHFEALFSTRPDPWSYETPYEQLKYRQTLDLIPAGPVGRALELACAEGRFTALLAGRVERLVAADISTVALERARARLNGQSNVSFIPLDLFTDPIPGPFDLVVCSEVLYFAGDLPRLQRTAELLAAALAPGGHLVLAHLNTLGDSDTGVGLDWSVPFGARTIGRTLASVPGLRFVRELQAPGYRIQLLRREPGEQRFGLEPEEVLAVPQGEAPEGFTAAFRPAGSAGEDRPRSPVETTRLPILMYHRIGEDRAALRYGFQVTPAKFAEQMAYLRDSGFYTVDLDTWDSCCRARVPLPGRAVVLTFDDGYADFADAAWPVLKANGFTPLVFLIAGYVGGDYEWDFSRVRPVPLMDWDTVRRLAEEGVRFGSHALSHQPLTGMRAEAIARELLTSRAIIETETGAAPSAIAYPYGRSDDPIRHLAAAAGYRNGLGTMAGRSGPSDHPLERRRIEISGFDSLSDFIAKIGD